MDNMNKLLSAAVIAIAAVTGTALAQQGGQPSGGSPGSPPGAMGDQSGAATSPRAGQPSMQGDRGAATDRRADRTAGTDQGRLSAKTRRFIQQAMMGNMFEIESSQAIQQKTQNQDVKQLAQRLIDDHRKSDDQMHQVLQDIGYSGAVAQGPRGDRGSATRGSGQGQPTRAYRGEGTQQTTGQELDRSHQKQVQKLDRENGARADRDFVKMQVKAHKDTIKLFRDYARSGDNPQLKQFAQQTLPTLEEHLKMAQQVQAKVGRGGLLGRFGKSARS